MSPVATVKTLKIDGRDVSGRQEETILDVARAERHLHSPPVRDGRPLRRGRLPPVPGRGQGTEQAAARLRDRGRRGHGGHHRLRAPGQLPPHDPGVALHRAQSRLLGLRLQRSLRDCRCWPSGSASPTSTFPIVIRKEEVDASHERFVIDHNRCILCTRCVRVCDEIEGAHTWDIMGRGIDAKVITDLNEPWGTSETCTSCGKCVHVCPTGALFEKGRSVAEMVKRRQFLPYLTMMREENE